MKIELVQFTPTFPGKDANWRRIRTWAENSPADIVLFPELSSCGYMYKSPKEIEPFSDGLAALAPLEKLSARTGKLLVGGFAERAKDGLHNSAYAVGPDGTAVYRKIHLWNREKVLFEEGHRPCLLEYAGRKIGIEICYDLQFPELSAYLSRQGAELILAPTAWAQDEHGPSRGLHPHAFLAMASAYAYGICVAVANRTGTERGHLFPGQSCLGGPWGMIATLGSEEERQVLEVPFEAISGAKRPSPHNDLQTDPRMIVKPPTHGPAGRAERGNRVPPHRRGPTKRGARRNPSRARSGPKN